MPPLVDIVTQSSGQSAEEIERYITIPIEIQMAGIPHVTAVRTISLFGLSDVKIQFTYDFTYDEAQQWVINRLSQLAAAAQRRPAADLAGKPDRGNLPLSGGRDRPAIRSLDLKTIEDWMLERRFKAVPGVIDVTGWGGKTKTYDVTVDLHKLDNLRPDPAAGAAGAEQQQHQCRRPDGRFRARRRRWCAASA